MLEIYTDGACYPTNGGPGGWACVLLYPSKSLHGTAFSILYGSEPESTNNRMEMMAAIRALESLKTPRTIKLTTDSMYLKRGITEWIHNWKRQGWRNTSGAVKNKDLWKRLEKATAPHTIEWIHVRGHAGNYWNEQADQYAVLAKSRQTAGRTKPELVGADVRI